MDPIIVPLLSRRHQRGQAVQKLNHALPAAGLIATGLQALRDGARGFELALAAVEIGTSAVLVAMIVRSVREARRHGTHGLHHAQGVDWVDIWAAAVLFAEAAERWHLKHHVPRPTLVTALVTLGMGLFHGRITGFGRRRRGLRLTDDGIYVGGRPFAGFSAKWPDVTAIAITERTAEIRTRTGRVRRIDLADLQNADAVCSALEAARLRLTAAQPPVSPSTASPSR